MENKELVEKANVRSYVRKIGGKAVKIAAYVRGGGASAAKRVGKAALAAGAGHRALAYGAGKMAGKVVRGGAKAYWAAGKPQRAAFRAAQKIQFGGIKKLARAGAKIASLHPGVRQAKTFAREMRKKKELSEKSNVRSYIRNVAGRAVKVSSYVRNVGAGGVRAVKPIASKIIGRNLKVAGLLVRGAAHYVGAGAAIQNPAGYLAGRVIGAAIRNRAKIAAGAKKRWGGAAWRAAAKKYSSPQDKKIFRAVGKVAVGAKKRWGKEAWRSAAKKYSSPLDRKIYAGAKAVAKFGLKRNPLHPGPAKVRSAIRTGARTVFAVTHPGTYLAAKLIAGSIRRRQKKS